MPNQYPLGQTVTLKCEMRDRNDKLIDASNLRLLVKRPGAMASEIVSVTQSSTGKVSADYLPDEHGLWSYRFETVSGVAAAEEGSFQVVAREVPAP